MKKKPTKAQLNKISFASRKLADACDYIYDEDVWELAVKAMGEINRYVNRCKRD